VGLTGGQSNGLNALLNQELLEPVFVELKAYSVGKNQLKTAMNGPFYRLSLPGKYLGKLVPHAAPAAALMWQWHAQSLAANSRKGRLAIA